MNLREILTGNPNWKLQALGPNDDNGEPEYAVAYPYVAEQRATVGDSEARWGPEYVITPDGKIMPLPYEPTWVRSSAGTTMTNMPTAGLVQCGWALGSSVLRPDDWPEAEYAKEHGMTGFARSYDGPLPPLVAGEPAVEVGPEQPEHVRVTDTEALPPQPLHVATEIARLADQQAETNRLLQTLPQRIAEAMHNARPVVIDTGLKP